MRTGARGPFFVCRLIPRRHDRAGERGERPFASLRVPLRHLAQRNSRSRRATACKARGAEGLNSTKLNSIGTPREAVTHHVAYLSLTALSDAASDIMSDDEAASRYARRGQERSPHPFGGAGFFAFTGEGARGSGAARNRVIRPVGELYCKPQYRQHGLARHRRRADRALTRRWRTRSLGAPRSFTRWRFRR